MFALGISPGLIRRLQPLDLQPVLSASKTRAFILALWLRHPQHRDQMFAPLNGRLGGLDVVGRSRRCAVVLASPRRQKHVQDTKGE